MKNKNIPYVKQYDQDGVLLNPLSTYEEGEYKSKLPNRRQRRDTGKRFVRNNKGVSLTVTEDSIRPRAFKRIVQTITHKIVSTIEKVKTKKNGRVKTKKVNIMIPITNRRTIGHYIENN